jgi:hypothetical protein
VNIVKDNNRIKIIDMGVTSTKNYHGELPKNTWEQTPSPTPHNIYQHKDDPENQLEEY